MHPSTSGPDPPLPRRRPLPVTITPGMPVVEIEGSVPATIVGFTQAFCVYRMAETEAIAVANWRDVAVGNVCPAEPLLPADVRQRDRDNAGATVLRDLLRLQQFGLTAAQQATLDQLIAQPSTPPRISGAGYDRQIDVCAQSRSDCRNSCEVTFYGFIFAVYPVV